MTWTPTSTPPPLDTHVLVWGRAGLIIDVRWTPHIATWATHWAEHPGGPTQ